MIHLPLPTPLHSGEQEVLFNNSTLNYHEAPPLMTTDDSTEHTNSLSERFRFSGRAHEAPRPN